MSTTGIIAPLFWWHFSQNNSGGYFIDNDKVSHDVFIQARNADEARHKAEEIFKPYSEYCECCGPRWDTYCEEEYGKEQPTKFDTVVTEIERGIFRHTYVLHHADGRVEKLDYK